MRKKSKQKIQPKRISRTRASTKHQLVIIGAGWSGMYMLKHALEEGLDAIVLEANAYPFGIWHYSRLPGGVLRNTHTTSSKYHMSPSDFPFPDETPDFPHHDIVEEHLYNYMKHFKLNRHIRYNSSVSRVVKKTDEWIIELESGEELRSQFVVVASGLNKVPSLPKEPLYKKFSGESYHTHYFEDHRKPQGKNILVIGGGETACDIAHILCRDNTVHLSIRSGLWFQSTIMGANMPADMFQNRLLALNSIFRLYATGIFARETEFWWGDGGSGIPMWQPSSKLLNGVYNKSRDVIMDDISKGEIFPQGGVKGIRGNTVQFHHDGNRWHEIDTIIFGTGYDCNAGLAYLPKKVDVAKN